MISNIIIFSQTVARFLKPEVTKANEWDNQCFHVSRVGILMNPSSLARTLRGVRGPRSACSLEGQVGREGLRRFCFYRAQLYRKMIGRMTDAEDLALVC